LSASSACPWAQRGVKRALEAEAILSPAGDKLWNRTTIRGIIKKDAHFPHSLAEVEDLVAPGVAARLDPELSHGIAWASRHGWKVLRRERRPDGTYRNVHKYEEKPREEWIALPVPGSGVPREVAERARRAVEIQVSEPRKGQRVWELSGGILKCAECGRSMGANTVAPKKDGRGPYHYYLCTRKIEEKKRESCPNRNHRAAELEEQVRGFALRLIEDPDTLREQVEQQVRAEKENKPWLRNAREAATARERLAKLETVADNYRAQQAEGLISMAALREKLDGLAEERGSLEERVAALKEGESRLAELEALPDMVEQYLRDLPELVGQMPVLRQYELTGHGPDEEGHPVPTLLTSESIRHKTEGEQETERREAEAARGAKLRELYTRLGLRAAAHADGTLEITVAGGVMPADERGYPLSSPTEMTATWGRNRLKNSGVVLVLEP
jgi:hypothetical protein